MGWLLEWFGTAIAYILYPLLIQAPLQILNAIYRVFTFCCGADIGRMFFNSNIQDIKIDTTTQVFGFLVSAIYVALILIFIFLCVLTIEHLVTKKKIDFLSKVKWPLLALTSTVTIPISFVMVSGVSSLFMEILGGSSLKCAILEQNLNDIQNNICKGLGELAQSLNVKININESLTDVEIKTAIGGLEDALTKLLPKLKDLGLTDEITKISNTITHLKELRSGIENLESNIKEIQSIIQKLSAEKGEVLPNLKTFNSLNKCTKNLTSIADSWNLIVSDISGYCQKLEHIIPDVEKIKIKDVEVDTWKLLESVKANWNKDECKWFSFNQYWINYGDKQSLISAIVSGGKWGEIIFDKNKQCCLNAVNTGLNPDSKYTFDLVVKIYQVVTGNIDTNWGGAWNMSRGINFTNVGVGFAMICMTAVVVGMFSLMAARRFIELVVLAVFAIITAAWGIKDDGVKFQNCIKLIIGKIFSVTIAYAAFTIGIQLNETIINFISNSTELATGGSLTTAMIQILLTTGGLLGAKAITDTISTWVGDSNSFKETMMDVAAIKTGVGATVAGGIFAGKAGIKATKFGWKGLTVAGRKTKFLQTPEKKQQKAWQLAEKLGLGQQVSKVGEDGKAYNTFEFDKTKALNPNTAKAYTKIMNKFNKKIINDKIVPMRTKKLKNEVTELLKDGEK